MALNKEQKAAVVAEVRDLLLGSKLTVIAEYRGVDVKSMQSLRKSAKENSTIIKVVKNRLVKQALSQNDILKNVDTSKLKEQLLYAFNTEDEVAPAQALNSFAKTQPNLIFVGAITADGNFIDANDVKQLADLPSKDQLRAQLIGTISAPLNGFANVLTGNLRGVLNVLSARVDNI
jgi:large subunit ribosomal protein L10